MKHSLKLGFIVLLALFGASSLYAQTPKKKTGPMVQELQQQVIDLQTKLMECQNTAKANAPGPMKDALEAFQTFSSTVDTGINYTAYRDALIPLKVKVDRLPDNEQTAPMKKTLGVFVEAGHLWNISITSGKYTSKEEISSYLSKYSDLWVSIRGQVNYRTGGFALDNCGTVEGPWGSTKNVFSFCVKELGVALITRGQENIKGFPKP